MIGGVFGDDSGRYALSPLNGSTSIWNGSSFSPAGNSNVAAGTIDSETENGVLLGFTGSAGWAYDQNTSAYYAIGSANTWPIGGNSSGYVVGQDGGGTEGFVWNEANQSYNLIPGLTMALGISNNSQLVAGENQSGQAAVYTPAARLGGHVLGRRGHLRQ